MSAEQCNRCRFWRENMRHRDPGDENGGYGICRRKPPVIVETMVRALMPAAEYGNQIEPELGTTTMTSCSLWPATTSLDWCGEFAAIKADRRDA